MHREVWKLQEHKPYSLPNFLSYISYFDPTTTYSVDFQVQILLWIITKVSEKAQEKSAIECLLLTEYIEYIL